MRIATVIFFAAFSFTATVGKIETEDGVLVITKSNFNDAINDNEFVLIEFYAPWCGHCKALVPEYAKAAQKLGEMGSTVKLAKVDATVETELAEQHGVRAYPTLKFYRKGHVMDYKGDRQADDIVNWLLKKTGPAAKDLPTLDDAKQFNEAHDVAIVGFFKDQESEDSKTFLSACNAIDEYICGITSSEEVFSEHSAKDGQVMLFKKFDEGKHAFEGELTAANLQKFIIVHALPLIVDFSPDTAQKIFSGDIMNHLLVFLSKEAGHFEKYVDGMKEPAKKFRSDVLFVTINTDEADHDRILEFFGMKKDDVPAMRLIKLEREMAKYKPENPELSTENVMEFVSAFVDGKLERHYLAQDLPEDWDKTPVKVLVRTNFNEVVFNKDKDVLVEFYAPWCKHCQDFAPVYDSLGEKYKDSDSLVIAKMDATANELQGIDVTSFPTIRLYKKETNEPVQYSGERTLEGLSKFIESGGVYGQAADEAQEEDEDDDVPRKDEL